ncbi:DUF4148 domain-containing protein [Paraburkholderia phosphatilytica]|uniref:DUF4148 domain-containing protein n=1 Tax=Paraburkholderia phosphatilytica TaxID=2282883 RepID=UPI000E47B723|nr:DUF4148 domain-containing protein [Paraburkholderia phosphatilytica]
MNAALKRCLPALLVAASSAAFASPHLTPRECRSYPFAATHGPVTQDDMTRELTELEAVGYRPAIDNYSPDISDARARLNAEYMRDCTPTHTASSS